MFIAEIKGITSSKPLYKKEFENKKDAESEVKKIWEEYANKYDSFSLNYWTNVYYECDDCGGFPCCCGEDD